MDTHKLFLDIVGSIYEAAAEPALWPRVLQKIADITQAVSVFLPVFPSLDSPSFSLVAAVNLPDDFRMEYAKYAHANSYFVSGARFFSEIQVFCGERLVPEREFLRTEFYNDFFRRFDLCYICGGPVFVEPPASAILTVLRPPRSGAFGGRETATLRPLVPHFTRALQLHHRFSAIEAQGRGLLEGIGALPTGFVLVDARGRILLMNRSAEAILSQNDGLSATSQSLRAMRASESEKLRQIVWAAARTGASNGAQAGGAISISRPSLRRPYSILVFPLRLPRNPFPGVQTPAAAIFISDPDARPQPEQHVLRQLFSLTAAEGRLAAVILQGSTLQKAAELLGVSRNTVHSQLRAIFDKTRTNRQAELIGVLNGALASTEPLVTRKQKKAA